MSPESWIESYRWPIAFILVVIILGAAFVFMARNSEPSPLVIATPSGSFSSSTSSSLKVYVSGAVKNPGVYTLKEGDRVADALEAAGGFLPESDPSAVNLARRVSDEMQIYVPKLGEAPSAGAGEAGKLDINRASKAELEALPGIGPVTAEKILDYRKQKGSFNSTDELLNAKLVSRTTFEAIKDKITIR